MNPVHPQVALGAHVAGTFIMQLTEEIEKKFPVGKIQNFESKIIFFCIRIEIISTLKHEKAPTVMWHHLQWRPVIPLELLICFRHLEHLSWVLPSTQWCSKAWAILDDFTYVEMHEAGALWTQRSCTVYLHTVKIVRP